MYKLYTIKCTIGYQNKIIFLVRHIMLANIMTLNVYVN